MAAKKKHKRAKVPTKKVTVALKDLPKLCNACGKVKESTYERSYRAKNYEGPCGDSFCYATCKMSACVEVRARVCDDCKAKGKVPQSYDA